MKTAISVLLMVGALAAVAPTQDFEEPASREKIASWLDFAAYKLGDYEHVALVEFYYGLLRHQLTFEDMDTFYQATAYVWLEIFNDKGSVIDTLHKVVPIRIFDPFSAFRCSLRASITFPSTYLGMELLISPASSTNRVGIPYSRAFHVR